MAAEMIKKRLIWLIPLALLLLLAAGILALPGFVASGYHRNTIEALASSLTGRQVHISGKLSLALLPEPQLIAQNITITGQDHETFTAKSLTLDIAPGALLRGRLSARSITLQSPQIALPWPLPGGAAAVAPPPWLTTLHAQIINGQVSLGATTFNNVSADVFTGAGGSLAVSGTGNLYNQPLELNFSLGSVDATGTAPLAVNVTSGTAVLRLSGNFNNAGAADGTAKLTVGSLAAINPAFTQAISATATFHAGPDDITIKNLRASAGSASFGGTAAFNLHQSVLNAALTSNHLNIPLFTGGNAALLNGITIHLVLDARNSTLAGLAIPAMALTVDHAAGTTSTQAVLRADYDGNTTIEASGTLGGSGQLHGQARLHSTGLNQLLSAAGSRFTLPDAWQSADLTAALGGSASNIVLGQLAGKFGPAHVSGGLVIAAANGVSGTLHFDRLDLAPLLSALRTPPPQNATNADVEITADHAGLNGIEMTHLLVDAAFHGQLIIRRITASAYGGLAAGSFTLSPGGDITAAQALLSVPSAAPLAALLPASWQPPKAVAAQPLAISILAAGPATALATSATATLGDTAITAAPTLDLIHQTAAGAFTLRQPSAIAAFKAFGLNAGLPWPGAGSISLRAYLQFSLAQMGLPDFVLSMGDLTATGSLMRASDGTISGALNADTLALPPVPQDLTPLWNGLAAAKGKITISANRVWLGGMPLVGPVAAIIALQPYTAALNISHAGFGGGALSGSITATTAANAPPSLAAKFALTNAAVSTFALPQPFPLTFPTGTLAAQGALTATGYGPKAWGATLSGAASLSIANGGITGFDLAALTKAMARLPRGKALTNASLAGITPFTAFTLSGNFNNGIYTLSNTTLQSPGGTATATGNIDVPDQTVALNLSLFPAVPSPPKIGLSVIGGWAGPKKTTDVKAGIAWKPKS